MIEAFQGKTAQVHATAYVHPSAVLIGEIRIGARSGVWPNATLRADDAPIIVGEETSIQDNVVIHCTEGISVPSVGSRVTVGHSAILHGCEIHDECLIGMGSVILDNAVVETGALVAAGTLIPPGKIVRAGTMVMGNPFQVVRTCGDKEREWIEFSWKAYVRRTAQYLDERGTTGAE